MPESRHDSYVVEQKRGSDWVPVHCSLAGTGTDNVEPSVSDWALAYATATTIARNFRRDGLVVRIVSQKITVKRQTIWEG